jgi:hypothetical protein
MPQSIPSDIRSKIRGGIPRHGGAGPAGPRRRRLRHLVLHLPLRPQAGRLSLWGGGAGPRERLVLRQRPARLVDFPLGIQGARLSLFNLGTSHGMEVLKDLAWSNTSTLAIGPVTGELGPDSGPESGPESGVESVESAMALTPSPSPPSSLGSVCLCLRQLMSQGKLQGKSRSRLKELVQVVPGEQNRSPLPVHF